MRTRPPREWLTYTYHDARVVLVKLREIEHELAGVPLDDRVRRLRTRGLRIFHERRQAAIFCYAMGVAFDTPIEFAPIENEDFDCIAHWRRSDEDVFTAIQIKELVPSDLNPKADLGRELEKLKKYVRSRGLVVAFHINRRIELSLSQLSIPELPIGELWFFGSITPDSSEYMLYGDVLTAPQFHRVTYPTPAAT
jgi:hypothetical protein